MIRCVRWTLVVDLLMLGHRTFFPYFSFIWNNSSLPIVVFIEIQRPTGILMHSKYVYLIHLHGEDTPLKYPAWNGKVFTKIRIRIGLQWRWFASQIPLRVSVGHFEPSSTGKRTTSHAQVLPGCRTASAHRAVVGCPCWREGEWVSSSSSFVHFILGMFRLHNFLVAKYFNFKNIQSHFRVKLDAFLKEFDAFEIDLNVFQIEVSFLQIKLHSNSTRWFLSEKNLA